MKGLKIVMFKNEEIREINKQEILKYETVKKKVLL